VKSTTVTLAEEDPAVLPFASRLPLLLSVPTTVGVKTTFTVACPPTPSEPTAQVTLAFTAAVHDPGVAVADANVAPEVGRLSVKITLAAGLVPVFLMA
jgi:hypothetical protein